MSFLSSPDSARDDADYGDDYDQQLSDSRDEALSLGWDIVELAGDGFAAVPHGTEIISAGDLDTLLTRLWAHLPLIGAPALATDAPAVDRYRETGVVRPAPDDGLDSGG